ncbi:MAG: GDSL-type esterase/lipase family protein [Bacteroidota bacterium]
MKKLKFALFFLLAINVILLAYIIKINYKKQGVSMQLRQTRQSIYDMFSIDSADIVFIGDSQTQRFNTQEFFPNIKIKNRGIDSDGSFGLLNRLDSIISGCPKKVFIQIGTNDIKGGLALSETVSNIKKALRKIKINCPSTYIYIQSVLPRGDTYAPEVVKLNNLIQGLCKSEGVSYVDIYTPFLKEGLLNKQYEIGDGLHLNGNGYLLWAKILYPLL